jgi:hypothetical protein
VSYLPGQRPQRRSDEDSAVGESHTRAEMATTGAWTANPQAAAKLAQRRRLK